MLVSWDWLQEYVRPAAPPAEVGERLMKAGLNLESIEDAAGDPVLDLEVTSNRPDCLGHIGVAREVSVLFGCPLKVPAATPQTSSQSTSDAISVKVEEPSACPRYIARVIRGVKIGPSPDWLRKRLEAVGQKSVNNVVDVTNYVLLESGQPFHTFDLARLKGQQIVVRQARAGETIAALNQKDGRETYKLDPTMLVIADVERPVAIAGVMGGLETGITTATTDLLLETADFAALAIRGTARKLALFSPSQYRFERGVDREAMDWASRRCAELILQVAGGELLEGSIEDGIGTLPPREPVRLRFAQIKRVLGIDVPAEAAVPILQRLGLKRVGDNNRDAAEFISPSWRRDLTREIDLIEEIARVFGYDAIPDDAAVPMSLSRKSELDRVRDRVRNVLVAHGFDEALTLSFVSAEEVELFDPLPGREALAVEHSSRRHENRLRKSLIPSLLRCRRENERKGTFDADLFEIAKVYLTAAPGRPEVEVEPIRVSFVSGRSFRELKGVVESVIAELNRTAKVEVAPSDLPAFAEGQGAELTLNGRSLGWIGVIGGSVRDSRLLELRDEVTVAELDFAALLDVANLFRTATPVPSFPAIERDLNFVLDEDVTWSAVDHAARSAAGDQLERAEFLSQFRGKQLGPEKKSYVIRLIFRAPDRTLTSDEVDGHVRDIVAKCEGELKATLRA
ncbi:MAG: phenylalanine--tRNA ligase subunit beta [Planctomycetaceae bacterium]|nr:phenylalanine--tRNA ligase subunit beta [Planctomycetaceae bacterium]